MSTGFSAGQDLWRARLGTLRQVVRQELVARQLALHVTDARPRRVLDVGCGQGTQSLLLARRGHAVTAIDSSPELLDDFRGALSREPREVVQRIRLLHGDAETITDLFPLASFDVVLCHGVLMYFSDPAALLDGLAHMVAPGGIVSLLCRNGDALAMRPGLLGDWEAVRGAFDGDTYLNRIGVHARADRLANLTAELAQRQLTVSQWYGVRVFTDTVSSDAGLPEDSILNAIIDCEDRAGRTDPYRHVAALLHLIATR